MKLIGRIFTVAAAEAAGAGLTAALFHLIFAIRVVDPLYYRVHPADVGFDSPGGLAALALGAALPLLTALRRKPDDATIFRRLAVFNSICFPFILLIPLLLGFPFSYWTLLATLAAGGLAAFRFGMVHTDLLRRLTPEWSPRTGWIAVSLLLAAGVCWGTFSQIHAYRVLFLVHQDWGEYALGYLRIAFGDQLRCVEYLMTGMHWNPAVNLFMAAIMRVFPSPVIVFFVSALAVYSTIPLVYLLARKHKIPVAVSLVFALLVWFNPVVSNQCLSLLYGYHPIYFFMPVLIAFFIFQSDRNTWGMVTMVVLSLLIQETVALFWFGYAVYWLLHGRYWRGALTLVGTAVLFFVLSHYLLAATYRQDHYTQLFHYSRLGASMSEVVLSPLLRPAVFLSALFSEENALFVASLALPLIALCLTRPLPLIIVLPLLVGVCLQDPPERQNIIVQYGVEATTLMLATAIAGYKAFLDRRPVCFGIRIRSPRRWQTGAVLAAIACTFGGYYCFGKSIYLGKYSFAPILAMPDQRPLVGEIADAIEPDAMVKASERFRGHLMFGFRTARFFDDATREDYLVLDVTRPLESFNGKLEALRRRIAFDPDYVPVKILRRHGLEAVLYRRLPPAETPRTPQMPAFITDMDEAAFAALGPLIPQNDDRFEVRTAPGAGDRLRLFVRVKGEADYDVDVRLTLRGEGTVRTTSAVFGRGVYPAYRMKAGQVCELELDLPPADDRATSATLELVRRPFSGPDGR